MIDYDKNWDLLMMLLLGLVHLPNPVPLAIALRSMSVLAQHGRASTLPFVRSIDNS
jgi:hypothetical protein